jgi:cell wall-associated NlpC family hydrolase
MWLAALIAAVSGEAGAALPPQLADCRAEVRAAWAALPLLDALDAPMVRRDELELARAAEHSDSDPRQLLVALALGLREIRYRRGGRNPQHGFDCSGFVHYVFEQALGIDLPANSTAQFHAGAPVDRAALRVGDLVFFRTRGPRVSHVGIYLGDGRFIHAPTTGERVRVDRLGASYWVRRFAGARRPDALS